MTVDTSEADDLRSDSVSALRYLICLLLICCISADHGCIRDTTAGYQRHHSRITKETKKVRGTVLQAMGAGSSTCRDMDPWPVWPWPTDWMPELYLADSSCAATSNWAGLESVAQPSIMIATLGQYSPTCHSTCSLQRGCDWSCCLRCAVLCCAKLCCGMSCYAWNKGCS